MRILAAIAIMLVAGCATCKSGSFANDAYDRPVCRADYEFVFPDNTVLPVPWGLTWRDLQCLKDKTFCFDDDKKSEFRANKDRIGLPDGVFLWRI